MVGFIHLVSPVKSGQKNKDVLYYEMKIQTNDELYRGISYRQDLREKLIKHEEDKTPIKIKKIKRKINYIDNSKIEIEINNETELIAQNEVPFKYRKVIDDLCPVVTISAVLKEKKNNDCISLHCYINVEDRPTVRTTLRYSANAINKKEVGCNDDTGTIKLTLWGTCVDHSKQSGVCFIQNAKVREYPKGVISITTTPSTTIKQSERNIVKSKSSIRELVSYCVELPPSSVQVISSFKCWPECGKSSKTGYEEDAKLFTCEHCHTMTLKEDAETRYNLKLSCKNSCKTLIVLYYPQLNQYFKMKSKSIPENAKLLVFELLSDKETELVIDSRSVCIGVKKVDV